MSGARASALSAWRRRTRWRANLRGKALPPCPRPSAGSAQPRVRACTVATVCTCASVVLFGMRTHTQMKPNDWDFTRRETHQSFSLDHHRHISSSFFAQPRCRSLCAWVSGIWWSPLKPPCACLCPRCWRYRPWIRFPTWTWARPRWKTRDIANHLILDIVLVNQYSSY